MTGPPRAGYVNPDNAAALALREWQAAREALLAAPQDLKTHAAYLAAHAAWTEARSAKAAWDAAVEETVPVPFPSSELYIDQLHDRIDRLDKAALDAAVEAAEFPGPYPIDQLHDRIDRLDDRVAALDWRLARIEGADSSEQPLHLLPIEHGGAPVALCGAPLPPGLDRRMAHAGGYAREVESNRWETVPPRCSDCASAYRAALEGGDRAYRDIDRGGAS